MKRLKTINDDRRNLSMILYTFSNFDFNQKIRVIEVYQNILIVINVILIIKDIQIPHHRLIISVSHFGGRNHN